MQTLAGELLVQVQHIYLTEEETRPECTFTLLTGRNSLPSRLHSVHFFGYKPCSTSFQFQMFVYIAIKNMMTMFVLVVINT